jgi:hypothetical protein
VSLRLLDDRPRAHHTALHTPSIRNASY